MKPYIIYYTTGEEWETSIGVAVVFAKDKKEAKSTLENQIGGMTITEPPICISPRGKKSKVAIRIDPQVM